MKENRNKIKVSIEKGNNNYDIDMFDDHITLGELKEIILELEKLEKYIEEKKIESHAWWFEYGRRVKYE